MGNPPARRDVLAGSILAGSVGRMVGWFSGTAAGFWKDRGIISQRENPWKTGCLFILSALIANGFALRLTHQEPALWGILLRFAGLGVCLLGLFSGSDGRSLKQTSLLARFVQSVRKGWK